VDSYLQFRVQGFGLIAVVQQKIRSIQNPAAVDVPGSIRRSCRRRTGPGADNVGPPSPVPVESEVSVDHQKPESAEVADY
jgi:hypothetical protein